ncbi:MAG: nucleoside triphosphate pyrophosphohydrolase [Thermodesulfobacteriota bacterium]
MSKNPEDPTSLDDLRELLIRLRGDKGCPWDRKQDPESLKIYLLEEAYELADALDRREIDDIREELGDLLFQIVFLSRLYEEQGLFDLDQVLETIHRKMVRRHPHVFGNENWETPREVVRGWQELKKAEKKEADPFASVPINLPPLLKAHRISERAAGLGFDWPDLSGVLDKVREEMKELEEALREGNRSLAGEELGDLLFSLVNLGRFLEIPAENALRKTIQKFSKRFAFMLEQLPDRDKGTSSRPLEEWEKMWVQSKRKVK